MNRSLWLGALVWVTLVSCSAPQEVTVERFHLGDWEKDIGYAQAVQVGDRILVSGTVGDDTKSKDTVSQMTDAYEAIKTTLAHYGAGLTHVVKETIYCRNMDDVIAAQALRKTYYQGNLPAATWVQVERLYSPGHLIEIEVEAVFSGGANASSKP